MRNLKDIIAEVKQVCDEKQINADGNTILNCSVTIYNTEYINSSKNNSKNPTSKKNTSQNSNKPSEQQKKYIQGVIKYKGDVESLTRHEASKMINEHKNKEPKEVRNDFA